jgi:hypothetical protein
MPVAHCDDDDRFNLPFARLRSQKATIHQTASLAICCTCIASIQHADPRLYIVQASMETVAEDTITYCTRIRMTGVCLVTEIYTTI